MTTDTVSVPAVMPRVQYLADGVTRRFGFGFPLFDPADLAVFLNAAPQHQGFIVEEGAVSFDAAPAGGTTITLERRLVLERRGGFSESGPLSAASLNTQLDRLTASVQQVAGDQGAMLRYPATDLPATATLPSRAARAGMLLGFDETGNPVALPPTDAGADTTYVPLGAGAVQRPVRGKLDDMVSVKDFGAVGDGVADDTIAFQAALAAHRAVFVPAGAWRISGPITLGYGQSLFGVGEASVIQARAGAFDPVNLPEYPSAFNAIELVDGYATVRDLRIVGGATGIKLYGRDGPCVKCVVENVSIWDSVIGIVLDGYQDTDRPCYWNHIARVLVARPQLHGVLLTVESSGDTPNANKFHDVRVYSLAAPLAGCGFFISAGRFNNSFVDCEANLHPGGEACFRLGAATDQNLIVNFYAESLGALPGIRIDNGSQNTSIVNLFSATGGSPIWDPTEARAYTAVNAGFPLRNDLKDTRISDLMLEGLRLDTEYVEPPGGGLVEPVLTSTTWLVSSFGGAVEFRLPQAGTANGRIVTVKKTDSSPNPVRITEQGGNGPDNQTIVLASRYDRVTCISNGAGWWVVGGNVQPANTEFVDGQTLFSPDLLKPLYLVSASAAPVEVRLPAPATAGAAGRTVTIKKSDLSDHAVTVTAEGGDGPEGRTWVLGKQYDFVTVTSNGGDWWVLGGRSLPATITYRETPGIVEVQPDIPVWLVSGFVGPITAQLPAPSIANAGRQVTVKRTDNSGNSVIVSVAGGTGPDGAARTLTHPKAALTVISNGAAWHVLGLYPGEVPAP